MSRGIRGYGPGKFNTIVDAVVYDMIGSGMGSESCGDTNEVGFYAESIVLGDRDAVKEAEEIVRELPGPRGERLTPEERKLILDSFGAIMIENDQGFVSVKYYDTEKDMAKDWATLEEDAHVESEEDEG